MYDELRHLARRELRFERYGHTINTTALVHEAYIELINHPPKGNWDGRRHFFGIAARAMRQILVNYAKLKPGKKEAGNRLPNLLRKEFLFPMKKPKNWLSWTKN